MDYENRKNMECIFTENKESDEKIRKELIRAFQSLNTKVCNGIERTDIIDWLEKQGQTFTKKDVEIAYLKGVHDTKHELEKQESIEEIVSRCKASWYNEGKMHGKMEGLTDDEKYKQGWHDALEKQSEQKSVEWNEEEQQIIKDAACVILACVNTADTREEEEKLEELADKLQDLKHHKQGEQKQEDEDISSPTIDWVDDVEEIEEITDTIVEWEDEDDAMLNQIIEDVEKLAGPYVCYYKDVNWLKSLKDRIQGKTSSEVIKE